LVAFASLYVGTDLLQLAKLGNQLQLGAGALSLLLLLNLPQILYYVLPMATLMAVLLTLSRLSGSSEIVAMEAGGVSRQRIAAPMLWLGLTLSCTSFILGEMIVPKANLLRSQILSREEQTESRLLENVILRDFKDGQLSRLLYAKVYDGARRVMKEAVVQEFSAGKLTRTIKTSRIRWDSGAWYYSDGEAYEYLEDGRVVTASFNSVRQPLRLSANPSQIAGQQKTPEEMSWGELKSQIAFLRQQGEDARKLEVLWHQKMAIPLACLIFALVGAPLGIQPHRSASSKGFGLSVVIIFVYYLILSLGSALGEGGQLPAALGAWLENILLGGWGIYLFWESGR
jgi:lipopolysaccharide export system permease protein